MQRILLSIFSCDIASTKRKVVKYTLMIRHYAMLIDPNNRPFFFSLLQGQMDTKHLFFFFFF